MESPTQWKPLASLLVPTLSYIGEPKHLTNCVRSKMMGVLLSHRGMFGRQKFVYDSIVHADLKTPQEKYLINILGQMREHMSYRRIRRP